MTQRYFSDWLRDTSPALAATPASLEAEWQRYLAARKRTMLRAFFEDMKAEHWFREKYDPADEFAAMRERTRARGRQGGVERFLKALEGGQLDEVNFDYGQCRECCGLS